MKLKLLITIGLLSLASIGFSQVMQKNTFQVYQAADHWEVKLTVNANLLKEKMVGLHPGLKDKDVSESVYQERVHDYVQEHFKVVTGTKSCRLYAQSYEMGSLAGNLVCILDGADWEPSFMKIKVTFLHEGNDEVINHLELLEGSNTKSSEFTDEYNAATYDFSTHKFQYIDDFDAETERHHYWAAIAFMGLALLLLLGFLFSDIGKKA